MSFSKLLCIPFTILTNVIIKKLFLFLLSRKLDGETAISLPSLTIFHRKFIRIAHPLSHQPNCHPNQLTRGGSMLSTVIDVAESGAGWCGMVRCHLIYNANANCSINWSKCAATSGRLSGFTKWPPPLYHINFLSGRIRTICSLPEIPSPSPVHFQVLPGSALSLLSSTFMGIESLNWFITKSFVNVFSFVKS